MTFDMLVKTVLKLLPAVCCYLQGKILVSPDFGLILIEPSVRFVSTFLIQMTHVIGINTMGTINSSFMLTEIHNEKMDIYALSKRRLTI